MRKSRRRLGGSATSHAEIDVRAPRVFAGELRPLEHGQRPREAAPFRTKRSCRPSSSCPAGEDPTAFGLPRIGSKWSVVRAPLPELDALTEAHPAWQITWSAPIEPLMDQGAAIWTGATRYAKRDALDRQGRLRRRSWTPEWTWRTAICRTRTVRRASRISSTTRPRRFRAESPLRRSRPWPKLGARASCHARCTRRATSTNCSSRAAATRSRRTRSDTARTSRRSQPATAEPKKSMSASRRRRRSSSRAFSTRTATSTTRRCSPRRISSSGSPNRKARRRDWRASRPW